MKLTTKLQYKKLLENGQMQKSASERDQACDFKPVVKLFTPDAGAIWLLSEIDPDDRDIAFGLCDLGLGFPELGTVSLKELQEVRGKLGLPVERDRHWKADRTISEYANDARHHGHIR
ncbi:MAG: DUF2958 domain-containing protein [Alphaproteobacteria bacterium]